MVQVLPATVPDAQEPITEEDAEAREQSKRRGKRKAQVDNITVAPVLYWIGREAYEEEEEVEEPDPQNPGATVKVTRMVQKVRDVQIPRTLPVNTETIPWIDFTLKAFRRYPGWAVICLAGSIVPGVILRNYLWAHHSSQANTFGIYLAVVLFLFLVTRMDNAVTRRGWAWRIDSQGQPWGDRLKWWKEDAAPWEDALRLYDIKGKRRDFWLDAMDEDKGVVRWFWPWGYPLPDPQLHPYEDEDDWRPTMADMQGTRTTGRSYQGLHRFETERAQFISKLFFYAIIGGSLILILVAGQKAANMIQTAIPPVNEVSTTIPDLPNIPRPPETTP